MITTLASDGYVIIKNNTMMNIDSNCSSMYIKYISTVTVFECRYNVFKNITSKESPGAAMYLDWPGNQLNISNCIFIDLVAYGSGGYEMMCLDICESNEKYTI
jgi:hypothetical protein